MLSNDERTKTKYVSIFNSTFTIRTNEGTEGAVERTTKSGKKVWEFHYSRLEGTIERISKDETEWEGKKIVSWAVSMYDEFEKFILKLSYSSREAKSLIATLPNIDIELPVALAVGQYKGDDGKDRPYLTVYQNGTKVAKFYGKDNLPPMNKIKVKGIDIWDDPAQMEILENVVVAKFPAQKVDVEVVDEPEGENDGLPF